jgi:hypothetical protein
MFDYCANNLELSKCSYWLYNAMSRIQPTINVFMQNYCTNNLFTPICETYINGLRNNNNDNLSDTILNNVWNNTKDIRMNCSFDNQYINKINAPKVCWNYDCMNTPNYLLLSKDVNNKSLCNLYQCSIILTQTVINNSSNIKLDCSNNINNNNSLLKISLADKKNNVTNFLPLLILPFLLLLS